jgi:transposase
MTKKKQYRRYSPEFKREALKRAAEEEVTDVQVCKELGISARQLRRWRDELRVHGESAFLLAFGFERVAWQTGVLTLPDGCFF